MARICAIIRTTILCLKPEDPPLGKTSNLLSKGFPIDVSFDLPFVLDRTAYSTAANQSGSLCPPFRQHQTRELSMAVPRTFMLLAQPTGSRLSPRPSSLDLHPLPFPASLNAVRRPKDALLLRHATPPGR